MAATDLTASTDITPYLQFREERLKEAEKENMIYRNVLPNFCQKTCAIIHNINNITQEQVSNMENEKESLWEKYASYSQQLLQQAHKSKETYLNGDITDENTCLNKTSMISEKNASVSNIEDQLQSFHSQLDRIEHMLKEIDLYNQALYKNLICYCNEYQNQETEC